MTRRGDENIRYSVTTKFILAVSFHASLSGPQRSVAAIILFSHLHLSHASDDEEVDCFVAFSIELIPEILKDYVLYLNV